MFRVMFTILPIIIMVVGTILAGVLHNTINYSIILPEPVSLEIKFGSSLKNIVKQLEANKLLVNPEVILLYARLRKEAGHFKAGEYEFSGKVTALEVLDTLKKGGVKSYKITLIEGHTLKQWLAHLHSHPKIRRQLIGEDALSTLREALGVDRENLEGLFAAETYQFSQGETDLAILQRSHKVLKKQLKEAWQNRAPGLPYKTAYEALIMASIVEKETGVPDERPRIAGVFVLRLNKRMLLQTDPTVIYGIGDKFDGNITRTHLRTDTPYNTYTRKGLPPTPIAIPSYAAIRAALHPDVTGELFFVARGDGSHQFSKTLVAHNKAVRQYQLKR